jgi:hypothetical protein
MGIRLHKGGGLLAMTAALALVAAGCTHHQAAMATPANDPPATDMVLAQLPEGSPLIQRTYVPQSLVDVGTQAQVVYADASAGDWDSAKSDLDWFVEGVPRMNADVPDLGSYKSQLNSALINLATAVNYRDRAGAMLAANSISRIAIFMSEPFNPEVPTELALLGYYARQLKYEADAGDLASLRSTAQDIGRTWYAFRTKPLPVANPDEAQMIDGVVSELQRAVSVEGFDTLADELIDSVENIEEEIQVEY